MSARPTLAQYQVVLPAAMGDGLWGQGFSKKKSSAMLVDVGRGREEESIALCQEDEAVIGRTGSDYSVGRIRLNSG